MQVFPKIQVVRYPKKLHTIVAPSSMSNHIPYRPGTTDGLSTFSNVGAVRSASGITNKDRNNSRWRLQSGFLKDHPPFGEVYIHATDGCHSIVYSRTFGWQEIASSYSDPNANPIYHRPTKTEDDEEHENVSNGPNDKLRRQAKTHATLSELRRWLDSQPTPSNV